MITCKELGQDFETKQQMFVALKASKEKLIGLKKAAIKESEPCSFNLRESGDISKAISEDSTLKIGDFIYPVINTTLLMDGHSDVHLNGIWDLSLKDQKGKVYYAINHELKIGSIISYPNEVEAYVKEINWADLGQPYTGKTQALIFKSQITDKSNPDFVKAVQSKQPLQNSIRMQYVDMQLCIDSDEKGMEEEYLNFHKHLSGIANKDEVKEQGYYWAIAQAKISKEGSAVLEGSNKATPILHTDPAKAGQQQVSPEDSSPKFSVNKLLSIF